MESGSDSQISFQQQEVIWAKIQGHPWWPAFVDQVHDDMGGKIQYTVNFFGDCTHSRLGASKLNKFQEFYAEHYPKARTHRKLMASIKLAEQTMKENEQDVQVFEDIRQELKHKRRWETKVAQVRRDRSSSNQADQIQLPIQSSRTLKSSLPSRGKAQTERIQQESSELKQQCLKRVRSQPVDRQAQWKIRCTRRFAEDGSQVQSFNNNQSIINQESNRLYDGIQQQSISNQLQRNLFKKEKTKKEPRQMAVQISVKPRKRGRPRKNVSRESLNDTKEDNKPNRLVFCPNSKRKIIHKRLSSGKFSTKGLQKMHSQEDLQIVKRTQQLMKNRQTLIEYLTHVTITPSNVQEILELGVVEVMRQGGDYKKVQDIISTLMNTLMLKYFPNDSHYKHKTIFLNNMHRKKKRVASIKKQPQIKYEKQEQGLKAKQTISAEECRKKTVLKLQKYLSRNSESLNDSTIRELSIQIEEIFFLEDKLVGQRYKILALKALNALKEGSTTPLELTRRLKEKQYD